jgi:hypothetical protein
MAAAGVRLSSCAQTVGRHGAGGVVGCLLFVAAGGRRGRGDLCRCSPTGALKATPAALLGGGGRHPTCAVHDDDDAAARQRSSTPVTGDPAAS